MTRFSRGPTFTQTPLAKKANSKKLHKPSGNIGRTLASAIHLRAITSDIAKISSPAKKVTRPVTMNPRSHNSLLAPSHRVRKGEAPTKVAPPSAKIAN